MGRWIPSILAPIVEPLVEQIILEQQKQLLKARPQAARSGGATARGKGKVHKYTGRGSKYIVTDQEKIVPFSKLKEFEIQKSSKQIQDEKTWLEKDSLAARPYQPEWFMILYESNATFFRTVNQIATDVAGLGWQLLAVEEEEVTKAIATAGEKEQEAVPSAKTQHKLVAEFLNHPNPDEPLRKILQSLIIDWGTLGYHALEVVRNDGGKVDEIYHLPAHTIFVHKGEKDADNGDRRQKYCQKRGQRKLWFKRFGLEDDISKTTGEKGEFSADEAANELIFTRTHYGRNDYYGIPNILPAVGSVLGLIGIRDYNLSFFTNYGVPAYLVTLSGDWEEGSEEYIARFLNTEIKGSENSHKTMVLQLPEDEASGETGTATFEPLSITEREGSFKVFYQVWQSDVLSSYSMPAYRIGILPYTSRLGSGSEARELTEVYKQGVVEPLQMDLEDLINIKLIEQGLGVRKWRFKFNDLDLRDLDKEVERYNSMIEHGLLMPNDVRAKLNLGDPYPGGNRYWMASNLKEMQPIRGRK